MFIIKIFIKYHVELILTKNYLHGKTVYTYFVFKACSLCSFFFENRYPYVNEVLKQSIIHDRMEIVGILLARIYLQRLKNNRVVIHIKNHDFCKTISIVLVLTCLTTKNQMCI